MNKRFTDFEFPVLGTGIESISLVGSKAPRGGEGNQSGDSGDSTICA